MKRLSYFAVRSSMRTANEPPQIITPLPALFRGTVVDANSVKGVYDWHLVQLSETTTFWPHSAIRSLKRTAKSGQNAINRSVSRVSPSLPSLSKFKNLSLKNCSKTRLVSVFSPKSLILSSNPYLASIDS